MSTEADYLARIQTLEKANRVLQRKLQRAQTEQIHLEETNEKKEFLLRKIIYDLNQAERQLQNLVESTATTTGQDFFPALVSHIAEALNVSYAAVTEQIDSRLQTLAFWANGTLHANLIYSLAKTPCEKTLQNGAFYCEGLIQQQFPAYVALVAADAESYLGIALRDTDGRAIGNLYILDQHPIHDLQRAEQILRVFAARAAIELERQRATTLLEQLNQALEAKVEERTVALQERENRYRALVEVIPDLMIRLQADGTFLDVISGEGIKLFNPEEFRPGNNIYEVLPFQHAQQRMFYVEQALQTRKVQVYDYELMIDGELRLEEARTIALNNEEVLVIVRDITNRKQAEARVQSLLNRTQLLNRISSEIRDSLDLDIILQNSVNAIFTEFPADICTFAWHKETDGYNFWEIVTEKKVPELPTWIGCHQTDDFLKLFQCVLSNQLYRIDSCSDLDEEPLKTFFKDMGIAAYICLPIYTVGGQIGSLQIGRIFSKTPWQNEEIELLMDIGNQVAIAIYQAQLYQESKAKTAALKRSYQELEEAQLQLVQFEKMSSLGQLVAGIAHEINNPVSFIYGNLAVASNYARDLRGLIHLYQENYQNPPQIISDFIKTSDIDYTLSDFPKLLTSMTTGATRIRDIVQSLRTFSRLDQSDYEAVNIHANIDNTLVILQNRLNGRAGNPRIQVIKNYGIVPQVECYSGLINQVFMNLLVNAIDAIEERDANDMPDYLGHITITTQLTSDNKVKITIEDNGVGMSPEIQAKIFNPFFTTKSVGVGTGMGLSISYQIVTGDHHGKLSCSSVLGEGTEFVIELWQLISQSGAKG